MVWALSSSVPAYTGKVLSMTTIETSVEKKKLTPDNLLVPKTLTRTNDPLILPGDLLSIFHGVNNNHFRLFANIPCHRKDPAISL